MTPTQFDATQFSKNTDAIYNGKKYRVYGIDTRERLLALAENVLSEEFWVRCENVEIVK